MKKNSNIVPTLADFFGKIKEFISYDTKKMLKREKDQ